MEDSVERSDAISHRPEPRPNTQIHRKNKQEALADAQNPRQGVAFRILCKAPTLLFRGRFKTRKSILLTAQEIIGIEMHSQSQGSKVKRFFEDCNGVASTTIKSSWAETKAHRASRSVMCQTGEDLYAFREMETQSGRSTSVIQDQVAEKNRNMHLLDYLVSRYPKKGEDVWRNKIEDGFVTVDCEVTTDPEARVDTEYFLEFVDCKAHVGVQTIPYKEISDQFQEWSDRQVSSRKLQDFLDRMYPRVIQELDKNLSQHELFANNLPSTTANEDNGEMGLKAAYYRMCTVDLEKKRVLFPDWNKARRYQGQIIQCTVTRNKDRIYDIEYDDGARCSGVKEEYIRLLGDSSSAKGANNREGLQPHRVREGVRVHCKKLVGKASTYKYFPGRVVRVSKSTNGTALYDVDIEGTGQIETNVTIEDLKMGLQEGQRVEAKRPVIMKLQTTDLCYNSTGNMVAASYGRHDIAGWCDSPGAVVCWNISARTSSAVPTTDEAPADNTGDSQENNLVLSEPEFVLDHNSCLMAVAFHPVVPSIVAAGSYNGEVVIWDLTTQDQSVIVSPINEYGHQQPILALSWVLLPNRPPSDAQSYLLASTGADGRLLFWTTRNRLAHPVKGFLITKGKGSGTRRNQLGTMGASCFALTPSSSGGQRSGQWLVLGQDDGRIVRCSSNSIFAYEITSDMLKSMPSPEDVFPPLNKRSELTPMAAFIGPVTSMDYSPFHRYLVLAGGCDGSVKLCHILQRNPILSLEPSSFVSSSGTSKDRGSGSTHCAITAVKFSPIRPTVFAVSTSEGFIYLYDLYQDMSVPVMRIEVTTGARSQDNSSTKASSGKSSVGVEPVVVTALTFNGRRKDILTASDWQGRVFIWRIPSIFSEMQANSSKSDSTERVLWDRLGRVHGGGDAEEDA